jgi:hypothetical protein
MSAMNDFVKTVESELKKEFDEIHAWLKHHKIKIWKFYTWVGTLAILMVIQQFNIPQQVDWVISFLVFFALVFALLHVINIFAPFSKDEEDGHDIGNDYPHLPVLESESNTAPAPGTVIHTIKCMWCGGVDIESRVQINYDESEYQIKLKLKDNVRHLGILFITHIYSEHPHVIIKKDVRD